MAAKALFGLCAQVFLIQTVLSQCLGRFGPGPRANLLGGPLAGPYASTLAGPLAGPFAGSLAGPLASPLASPLSARAAPGLAVPALAYEGCGGVASTGGGLIVTSASPIAPTGVSVVSENAIEGSLSVGGNLPLLGSVALEGAFPTAGAGAVSYGCGSGDVAIVSEEGPIGTGILAPGPVAPAPIISAAPGLAGSALAAPALAAPVLGVPSLTAPLGLRGARTGLAPGLRRGCGCGAFY